MVIDGAEVAQHASKTSCWVVLHGKVWDVTDFIDEHPGGAGVIMRCAGADATEAYEEIHGPELVTETLPSNRCLGDIIPGTIAAKKTSVATPSDKGDAPPLTTMVSVDDFERAASKSISPTGWAYYASGADDELSIADSRRLFQRMTLRPRILRRVEPVTTSTVILGCPSSLPIYFSPTGQGKYAMEDAECAIASTAGKAGLIYCMPTSAPQESVFAAQSDKNQSLFFQLYTTRDKDKAIAMIQRAEKNGAKAIFVTVDSPVLGKREKDDRLKAAEGDDTVSATAGGFAKVSSLGLLNPLLCWDDIRWMREATSLPIVVKGVQTVEDALLAHAAGVDGIVISHHGGRSMDTAQAPILTLLEIREHAPHLLQSPVRDRFQVLVDGGFRRGTDVIKALALGATAVGIGRPVLYSLSSGYGAAGLERLIRILATEIARDMALAGAASVDGLVPEMVNSRRAENEMSRRIKL